MSGVRFIYVACSLHRLHATNRFYLAAGEGGRVKIVCQRAGNGYVHDLFISLAVFDCWAVEGAESSRNSKASGLVG